MKQLELSELDSLLLALRVDARLDSGLLGEDPSSVALGGTGLLTAGDLPASPRVVVDPGRFDVLPPEGDGVGVELD